MKRIFCDCCGNEFEYKELGVVGGDWHRKNLPINKELVSSMSFVQVAVKIEFVWENVSNGKHIDICDICRWSVLDTINKRDK